MILYLDFSIAGIGVIVFLVASVLPKAYEMTSRRANDSDMMLMKVIFCSEILVVTIFLILWRLLLIFG